MGRAGEQEGTVLYLRVWGVEKVVRLHFKYQQDKFRKLSRNSVFFRTEVKPCILGVDYGCVCFYCYQHSVYFHTLHRDGLSMYHDVSVTLFNIIQTKGGFDNDQVSCRMGGGGDTTTRSVAEWSAFFEIREIIYIRNLGGN